VASYLFCRACGRRNDFRDTQPMRIFCDDECQRVWDWAHPKESAPKPEEVLAEGKDMPRAKALARAKKLVRLAVDPAASRGKSSEAHNAALAACRLIASHSLLSDVPDGPPMSIEDLMRWVYKRSRP
jgi:endogenous inhibitor of DNA gyrase (YacG/DUF329 family)